MKHMWVHSWYWSIPRCRRSPVVPLWSWRITNPFQATFLEMSELWWQNAVTETSRLSDTKMQQDTPRYCKMMWTNGTCCMRAWRHKQIVMKYFWSARSNRCICQMIAALAQAHNHLLRRNDLLNDSLLRYWPKKRALPNLFHPDRVSLNQFQDTRRLRGQRCCQFLTIADCMLNQSTVKVLCCEAFTEFSGEFGQTQTHTRIGIGICIHTQAHMSHAWIDTHTVCDIYTCYIYTYIYIYIVYFYMATHYLVYRVLPHFLFCCTPYTHSRRLDNFTLSTWIDTYSSNRDKSSTDWHVLAKHPVDFVLTTMYIIYMYIHFTLVGRETSRMRVYTHTLPHIRYHLEAMPNHKCTALVNVNKLWKPPQSLLWILSTN